MMAALNRYDKRRNLPASSLSRSVSLDAGFSEPTVSPLPRGRVADFEKLARCAVESMLPRISIRSGFSACATPSYVICFSQQQQQALSRISVRNVHPFALIVEWWKDDAGDISAVTAASDMIVVAVWTPENRLLALRGHSKNICCLMRRQLYWSICAL